MKLIVTFSRKAGKKPIIAQVVLDTGVLINVERALIDSSEGEALIDIPDDTCMVVKERLAELGATVRVLEDVISLDAQFIAETSGSATPRVASEGRTPAGGAGHGGGR